MESASHWLSGLPELRAQAQAQKSSPSRAGNAEPSGPDTSPGRKRCRDHQTVSEPQANKNHSNGKKKKKNVVKGDEGGKFVSLC